MHESWVGLLKNQGLNVLMSFRKPPLVIYQDICAYSLPSETACGGDNHHAEFNLMIFLGYVV